VKAACRLLTFSIGFGCGLTISPRARKCRGMLRRWKRPSCFSSAPRTRRLPPFQRNKRARCAPGRSGILMRETLTWPRWSATRCKAISTSSRPIRATRWPSACARWSRRGERRSPGAERGRSIRRRPIGRICGGIRAGRMQPTRIVAWRTFRPSLSRRRPLSWLNTICRRHRLTRSSISSGEFSCSTIRYSRSRRRHRRR
jgi:hypothetical protein